MQGGGVWPCATVYTGWISWGVGFLQGVLVHAEEANICKLLN